MTKEEQAVIDAAIELHCRAQPKLLRSAVDALKASRISPAVLREYKSRLKDRIRATYRLSELKLELPSEMYSQLYDDAEDEVRAELGLPPEQR